MILSHEKAFSKAKTQLDEMVDLAVQAAQTGERIDRVERELFWRLLAIGLSVLQGFVSLRGDGDEGARIERDGVSLQRLKKKHRRRYLSVFGEISILRWVYARREGQKIEHAPLDARLALPEGEFSYLLMDWLQRFCVHVSFHGHKEQACRDLAKLGGMLTGWCRSIAMANGGPEALNTSAFRASQTAPRTPPKTRA